MQYKNTKNTEKDQRQSSINKLQGKKFVSDLNKWELLTKAKGSPLNSKYRKSLSCLHTLDFKHKTAMTCKRRWCSICESKKMAIMIDKFKDQLEKKDNLYFVTLTAQTVSKSQLPRRLKDIQEIWRAITKYNRQELKMPFNGIRKLEITIAENDKYHAHIHILMDNYDSAIWLKKQWLNHWRKRTKSNKVANYKAQDIRKVENAIEALKEISKYVAKALELDREEDKKGAKIEVTPEKKDWIYQCLSKGRIRTISSFGDVKATKIVAKELDKLEEIKPKRFEANQATWIKQAHNWISKEGEELGTNDLSKEKEIFKSKYEPYKEHLESKPVKTELKETRKDVREINKISNEDAERIRSSNRVTDNRERMQRKLNEGFKNDNYKAKLLADNDEAESNYKPKRKAVKLSKVKRSRINNYKEYESKYNDLSNEEIEIINKAHALIMKIEKGK